VFCGEDISPSPRTSTYSIVGDGAGVPVTFWQQKVTKNCWGAKTHYVPSSVFCGVDC